MVQYEPSIKELVIGHEPIDPLPEDCMKAREGTLCGREGKLYEPKDTTV
jgi:hypothetical protein